MAPALLLKRISLSALALLLALALLSAGPAAGHSDQVETANSTIDERPPDVYNRLDVRVSERGTAEFEIHTAYPARTSAEAAAAKNGSLSPEWSSGPERIRQILDETTTPPKEAQIETEITHYSTWEKNEYFDDPDPAHGWIVVRHKARVENFYQGDDNISIGEDYTDAVEPGWDIFVGLRDTWEPTVVNGDPQPEVELWPDSETGEYDWWDPVAGEGGYWGPEQNVSEYDLPVFEWTLTGNESLPLVEATFRPPEVYNRMYLESVAGHGDFQILTAYQARTSGEAAAAKDGTLLTEWSSGPERIRQIFNETATPEDELRIETTISHHSNWGGDSDPENDTPKHGWVLIKHDIRWVNYSSPGEDIVIGEAYVDALEPGWNIWVEFEEHWEPTVVNGDPEIDGVGHIRLVYEWNLTGNESLPLIAFDSPTERKSSAGDGSLGVAGGILTALLAIYLAVKTR